GLLKHEKLLQKMVKSGHSLGSHCHQHFDLRKLSDEQIIYQIETFQKAIDEVFQKQYQACLIRPPFGGCDKRVNQIVNKYGVVCLWNLNSSDSSEWEQGEWICYKEGVFRLSDNQKENFPLKYEQKCYRIYDQIKNKCEQNPNQGQCILFHDTHNTSV
ncbi:polysaccharide deacetylase, putative, partial [Ichthyophthirius multifiliis]